MTEPPDCPHERIVLVETGYEREWTWNTDGDVPVAIFGGIQDFSDDGDSHYRLRCKTCLADFGIPTEEWEWE